MFCLKRCGPSRSAAATRSPCKGRGAQTAVGGSGRAPSSATRSRIRPGRSSAAVGCPTTAISKYSATLNGT
eukprot:4540893-Alexandrium_andersonii.AAC.1